MIGSGFPRLEINLWKFRRVQSIYERLFAGIAHMNYCRFLLYQCLPPGFSVRGQALWNYPCHCRSL